MEIRCNFKSNTVFPGVICIYIAVKKAQFKTVHLNKVLHAMTLKEKCSALLGLVCDLLGARGRFSCTSTLRAGMGAGSC